MKRKMLIGIAFYFILIPSVFACANPTVYSIYGSSINPLGGIFTVNGSLFSGLSIDYNFTVYNTNKNQGVLVTIVPDDSAKDYISGNSVYLDASETKVLPVKIWIGGFSGIGTV